MLGALAAYFINADSPPPRAFFGLFLFFSEKMTFLAIFDMYLIIWVIFSQYFVNIWYLINRGVY